LSEYRDMVATNWVSTLIGAVIALLIAILVPPYLPHPADTIISILAWIVCVILFVLTLVSLLRGRGV
jgi:uncharacterized protein YacL